MIKKYFHTLLIGTLIYSSGCVEDVFVKVEPAEEKIVISSLFIPDSIVIVTVSRSFSALSAKDLQDLEGNLIEALLVDRALVTISSDNHTDTLFRLSAGVYAGGLTNPRTLDLYALQVYDSATQTSVSSSTILKRQVRFDSVSINQIIADGDTTKSLYFEFTDPADQDNWYLVQGFELPRLPNFDNVTFDLDSGQLEVAPDTSNQVFFEPGTTLLFQDLVSDLTLEDQKVFEEIPVPKNINDTVVFVLINIDPGYYDFLQARKRSGGIVTSLTREPVNHPTNVQGGYGYFTMHTPHFGMAVRKEDE